MKREAQRIVLGALGLAIASGALWAWLQRAAAPTARKAADVGASASISASTPPPAFPPATSGDVGRRRLDLPPLLPDLDGDETVPAPFVLTGDGCPEGAVRVVEGARGKGCAKRDTDGGVVPHGPWRMENERGEVREGQMRDGKREGPWKETWRDGRRWERFFGADQQEGVEREYGPDGKVVAENHYYRSALHGVCQRFRRDGKIVRATYDRGELLEEAVVDAPTPAPSASAPSG